MSLPPKPRYAIVATDHRPGVRVGARVVYSLVRTNVLASGKGREDRVAETEDSITREYTLGHPYTHDRVLQPRVRWALLPEPSFHLERVGEAEGFSRDFEVDTYDVAVTWERAGVHRIKCFVEPAPPWDGAMQVATFKQEVYTPEEDAELADREWSVTTLFARYEGEPDAISVTTPERAATEMFRAIEVADELERVAPTKDPEVRWAYRRAREQQLAHAGKLYDFALRIDRADHRRHAIVALHVGAVDNVQLTMFVAMGRQPRVSEDGFADAPRAHVRVVDWTDASDEAYSGVYGGSGAHLADALASALLQWKRHNHYADGSIRFELPPELAEVLGDAARDGKLSALRVERLASEVGLDLSTFSSGLPLEGRFPTSTPVDVAAVLDHVALASAMLAAAAMFAAPVPGSRAVAAFLWTSAVTGAAASTIRIATRHRRAISDPTATAIDVLGIVSSLMMLPGAAAIWRQGANVAIRQALVHGTGTKVLKMSLVGQIGVDGVQGALIGAEAATKLRKVLEDERTSPPDRLELAAKLVAQLVAAGGLVIFGAKGNLDDLAALRTDASGLRRLGDPDAEIDLTDGVGSPGDTRKGKHVDVADVDAPADARMVTPRPELTPAARAALGELDDVAKARVRTMLDADEVGANLLLTRFGRDALDVSDAFATVWKRWEDYGLPVSWLRMYHEHTGLHGVRYFEGLPAGDARRIEYAAGGWACERETYFRSLYPSAGHSVARHGPHLPAEPGGVLEARVKTGYAADVAEHKQADESLKWEHVAAPTDSSSRFLSFVDWNDAHDSAYVALERQFKAVGVDRLHGPIPAKKGHPYPKASGYLHFIDIDDPTKTISRPLGESYEGVADGTEYAETFRRPDRSPLRANVYPTTVRIPSVQITYIFATMGWTKDGWIIINLYPVRLPKPGATYIGLVKNTLGGRTMLEEAPS